MGYARNCAKWRNIQKTQEFSPAVAYILLFLAGFISFGAAWIVLVLVFIADAYTLSR